MRDALEVAFGYDTSILAEPAQDGSIEINCSVLGWGDDVQASVCEQPVTSGTLSYADKYLSGGKGKGGAKAPASGMKSSQRIIPAPISESLTRRIQEAAMTSFRAIGAAGVARVDFLVSPDRDSFVVNELNTLPGLAVVLPLGSLGRALRRAARRASSTWRWRGTASSRQPRRRSTRGCSPVGRAERRPECGIGTTAAGATGEVPRAALEDRGTGVRCCSCTAGACHPELFAPILDALQPGRRLIVPDLPGFGATPEPRLAVVGARLRGLVRRAARPARDRARAT